MTLNQIIQNVCTIIFAITSGFLCCVETVESSEGFIFLFIITVVMALSALGMKITYDKEEKIKQELQYKIYRRRHD